MFVVIETTPQFNKPLDDLKIIAYCPTMPDANTVLASLKEHENNRVLINDSDVRKMYCYRAVTPSKLLDWDSM